MKSLGTHIGGSSSTHSLIRGYAMVRRSSNWARLILLMMIVWSPASFAREDSLAVTIDQARVINIPAGTDMLIVGNAAIADVTLLKAVDKVIVTGKSYGETNFIALGTAKNQLGEWQVQVIGGKNLLTVQRGMDRQTYSCAPLCQPSARLGDDAKYFDDVLKQAKDHNAQANGLP